MSRITEAQKKIIEDAWEGDLNQDFLKVFEFGILTVSSENPRGAFSGKGDIDENFIRKAVKSYQADKIKEISLKDVNTKSDSAVERIAVAAGKISEEHIEKASENHRWLMQSENVLGVLLEKYIDSKISKQGWLWCAGSFIKAVDFIYPLESGEYKILQIKNSSNSENSSSSAIRDGTEIEKWFRRYATTGKYNWDALNKMIEEATGEDPGFQESDFMDFINKTLTK
ncbi:SinI family restriction endonuclease [Deinococcus sp. 23YEL01]|uniref:SinI family restriction endonuclease n=1 Tax=Deinococcus sp. 23YEL01 TaxID=2745871 RepID=UPI001E5ADA40|nr:SinI family restriction endonuclease [Deinococcus sp. 23YEL01]